MEWKRWVVVTSPPTPTHTWTHDDPRRQDTDDDGARDKVHIHAEPGLEDLLVEDPELLVDLVENLNRTVPAGPDLVADLAQDGVSPPLLFLLIFLFTLVLGLCGCHNNTRGGCRQAESTQSVTYIRSRVGTMDVCWCTRVTRSVCTSFDAGSCSCLCACAGAGMGTGASTARPGEWRTPAAGVRVHILVSIQ